ncbi:uncharacterized protein NDAI_0I01350 [Naumovozyma dairenensis CBS 421]|uniref:ISWI chromatin-remodeling complex ATPase ISW2 n=1 Tax=Naumovozyma dairenensis (strain ATCC 10597 / BCRC 20456 / CBS 421 / NBRC 0211 / NRRL Y-12639) TaxID=1071378 RepID=G0WFZ3_NAUDC|nr:hypothetical protein NDAI_0I01350 [Naumovozyma dairenensis CBS 421]CCD26704.1 hypothetical protein NDAI_0I01350 [Naumovozyma dairenensis CBS 421]
MTTTPAMSNSNYLITDPKRKKEQFDIESTVKRFKHLLSLSGLFKHFIENKAQKDEKFAKVLTILNNDDDSKKKNSQKKRRKTEREEDAELLKEEEIETTEDTNDEVGFQFRESPTYIHGELRPYQIQGLNWLVSLHTNGIAGILADEMGLGKTLQTIAFLGYLRYMENINGPFLVIAPKSTLNNWLREINKWTPDVKAFVLQGDKQERADIIKDKLLTCDFDIVVASYEITIREKAALKKMNWQYIVIDEAHRIKNEESLLSQVLREFTSRNRLLITGTPLQNNLHELWALLNFLLPDIFSDSQDFDDWFSSETSEEDQDKVVKQLHTVLQPFLLRRIKSDVETSLLPKKELNLYVGMSSMQKKWYKQILEKDLDAVNGSNPNKESKTRLLNIVMQLRKCCNHPYLFDGAEPGPPYTTDEHLVYNSAKLKVLDKLLKKMKEEGSRVLIFSQMSRVLDILEDYCFFRGYKYCRIDGSTDHEDRIKSIDDYNSPDSDKFIFLLTTRAGGLGINLTSADVVVLYDSDWNPQADLQAMDRAHRIGQKKQVKVFRFVTNNSVEEKILERATQKLRLDQLVIQQKKTLKKENRKEAKDALLSMIQHGAADIFMSASTASSSPTPSATTSQSEPDAVEDVDLQSILTMSEDKTKSLNAKYETLGLDDLQKFNQESAYEWDGQNFKKQTQKGIIDPTWIQPTKRERKENYSIDNYYRDVLTTKKAVTPLQPRMPKPKVFYSHQLHSPLLNELYEKDRMWIAKKTKYVPTLDDVKVTYGEDLTNAEMKDKLKLLKESIDKAQPLTEEEEKSKQELEAKGFSNWNKTEFRKFITLSGKYGRNSIQAIATELAQTKSVQDVRDYAKAFWANLDSIEDSDKYVKLIEADEEKLKKLKLQQEALRLKVSKYKNPLFELTLKHPPSNSNKRTFSEEEDRFLLITLSKYDLGRDDLYDMIRDEIRDSPFFELDFFFQSRTPLELARRAFTLLQCIEKESQSGIVGPEFNEKKPKAVKGEKRGPSNDNKDRKPAIKKIKLTMNQKISNEGKKDIAISEEKETTTAAEDKQEIMEDKQEVTEENQEAHRTVGETNEESHKESQNEVDTDTKEEHIEPKEEHTEPKEESTNDSKSSAQGVTEGKVAPPVVLEP